jgi:hypothetical protein
LTRREGRQLTNPLDFREIGEAHAAATTVPEPGSFGVVVASALTGLGLLFRRRRRRQNSRRPQIAARPSEVLKTA